MTAIGSAGEGHVKVRGVWDGEAEARLVADDIESGQRKGDAHADMAVLVRASFQMRAFEERFNTLAASLSRRRRTALL